MRQAWFLLEQVSGNGTQVESITTALVQFSCGSDNAIAVKSSTIHVPTQQQQSNLQAQEIKIQLGSVLEQAQILLCQR